MSDSLALKGSGLRANVIPFTVKLAGQALGFRLCVHFYLY